MSFAADYLSDYSDTRASCIRLRTLILYGPLQGWLKARMSAELQGINDALDLGLTFSVPQAASPECPDRSFLSECAVKRKIGEVLGAEVLQQERAAWLRVHGRS